MYLCSKYSYLYDIPERLGEGPALAPNRVEYPESLWESWEPPSEWSGRFSSWRCRS